MDIKVFGMHHVVEMGPMALAVHRMGGRVGFGGAGHVVGKGALSRTQTGAPGVVDREPERGMAGNEVIADIGGNATTQLLRFSYERPDMRVIMTPIHTLYRMVARRSAGIHSMADLKGKRIGTYPRTSAAFYLADELERAGLSEADVSIFNAAPADEVALSLIEHRTDAIAIWEPAAENAIEALGDDAVVMRSEGAYCLLYALNTTEAVVNDPRKRPQIVRLLAEINRACRDINADPAIVYPIVAEYSKYPLDVIARCWHHHALPGGLAPDLTDWLVTEEKWVAVEQNRAPRTREELERLIDRSLLEEAAALEL